MFTIVQRGGATREKPPEVVRGQSSRLPWVWDSLCFAVPFNDATRDSARDLVANAAPSEWMGTPSFTKDNRGNVAALMPNDAYVGYADNPMHNRPTTALTAYVRMRRTGTPPVGVGFFAKVHTPGNVSPWITWGMYSTDLDATKMAASMTVDGTNIYWENTNYVTDTSTWISIFLRWTSGTAPVQDVLGERGQSYSTAPYGSTISGTLTYSSTSQPIRLNSADRVPPDNPTYLGAYSQAMVWSRRLSDTELQALVADPYGWYSPRRSTVVVAGPYPFGSGEMRGASGGIGGLY